jgi:hypothetical protein
MVRSATAPKPWVVRFRAYYYFCRKVERLGPWQSFVTAIQRARKRNYGRDVPKPSEALVWINVDGSARDLTDAEKRHVDADFSPFDGARPYIKSTYQQHNGWGELSGYLQRTEVPDGIPINAAPPESPPQQQTAESVASAISELVRKSNSGSVGSS